MKKILFVLIAVLGIAITSCAPQTKVLKLQDLTEDYIYNNQFVVVTKPNNKLLLKAFTKEYILINVSKEDHKKYSRHDILSGARVISLQE